MLDLSQNEQISNLWNIENSETQKTEKITKFIKQRVNEFRCEMQLKIENISVIITKLEYEKNKMVSELNSLRGKIENEEKAHKQNSIIKREKKLVRIFRILRENSYLWQEIEKEDVIELRNDFGELRGIIEKKDIVKAEQKIFETKKKYNFFRKLKDIRNIKYANIEASIKTNQSKIEEGNKEIESYELKIKSKIEEIESIKEIKGKLETLLEEYKEKVMESLEKSDSDKVVELIDILDETNQDYRAICGNITMLN